jgi:hypothetical protein
MEPKGLINIHYENVNGNTNHQRLTFEFDDRSLSVTFDRFVSPESVAATMLEFCKYITRQPQKYQ